MVISQSFWYVYQRVSISMAILQEDSRLVKQILGGISHLDLQLDDMLGKLHLIGNIYIYIIKCTLHIYIYVYILTLAPFTLPPLPTW